jgi:CHAT domain-containing protein/tetratricopeptide (TPR) repeat protein
LHSCGTLLQRISLTLGFLAGSCSLAACARDTPLDITYDMVLEAAREFQPTQLRWSGTAPKCVPEHSTNDLYVRRCVNLPNARAAIRMAALGRAVRKAGSADAHQVKALLDLLWASGIEEIDRAIAGLEDVVHAYGADADIHNNLAVAWGARARVSANALDAFKALDASLRALRLDPNHEQARFNADLLRRRLLPLNTFAESASAAEAANLRMAIGRAVDDSVSMDSLVTLSRRNPRVAREELSITVLPAWGHAVVDGEPGPGKHALAVARLINSALPQLQSVAEAIREAESAIGPQSLTLARGHISYALGRRAYNGALYQEAFKHLGEAVKLFEDAGSGYGSWPRLHATAARLQLGDAAGALADLNELDLELDNGGDPVLAGMIGWLRGLVHGRLGRIDLELADLEQAATAFELAGDYASLASVASLRAEAQFLLGDPAPALHGAIRALPVLSSEGAYALLHTTLTYMGSLLHDLSLVEASIITQEEALRISRRAGRSVSVAESTIRLSAVSREARSDSAMSILLAQIDSAVQGLPDATAQRRLGADRLELEAELILRKDPLAAIGKLDTVVARFTTHTARHRLASALAMRAAARLHAGHNEPAEEDLNRSLEILAAGTTTLDDPHLRMRADERIARAFDRAILLYAENGEPDRALRLLELSRNRQRPGISWPEGLSLDHRAKALPEDVAVLVFAALDTHVLTWALTRDTVLMRSQVWPQESVRRDVDSFERAVLTAGIGKTKRIGAPLFAALIQPIFSVVGARSRWVLVPDRALRRVPFAALSADTVSPWLIEDYELAYATDLSTALRRVAEVQNFPMADAAIISDPGFDAKAFPDLQRLNAASEESRAVAAALPGSVVIHGTAAHRAGMVEALRGKEILHFAGHARAHPTLSELSHLVLAPDPGGMDNGRLPASEIRHMDLEGVTLVVLSACSAMAGRDIRGGGMDGLAGSFLEAGATSVVASLWPVDDERAADFFSGFYRALARTSSVSAALRSAQLQAITTGLPVRHWAPFRLLEGRLSDLPTGNRA